MEASGLNFRPCLRKKREKLPDPMPVYQYKVMNSKMGDEIIEIEQEVGAEELTSPPITGESIQKMISVSSLTLNHSSIREKKSLNHENLTNKGFSVFKRDHYNPSKYVSTVGKQGPEEINLN